MKDNINSNKIQRISLAEKVVERIIDMIERSTLKVGDLLPTEKELTELFGVGRSSVREALRALQSMGVIEKRQGSGTYVKSSIINRDGSCFNIRNVLQRFSMIELSETRKIIEEQNAALAALNSSEESIALMQEANNRLRFRIDSEDKHEIVNLDFQVHRSIAEGTGISFLVEILDMLLEVFMEFNEVVLTREKTEIAIDFHQKIINCIKEADAKGARRLMKEHLTDVHERIILESYGPGEIGEFKLESLTKNE
jgi:GntR family transcriptional repressor for pyruvate dehydrogenase complex